MNAAISVMTYAQRHPIVLLCAREETSAYEGFAPDEPEAATDWTAVHERIVALREERAAHDRELCRWLLAAERLGVHARAGHASLREYADRVVGLSGARPRSGCGSGARSPSFRRSTAPSLRESSAGPRCAS